MKIFFFYFYVKILQLDVPAVISSPSKGIQLTYKHYSDSIKRPLLHPLADEGAGTMSSIQVLGFYGSNPVERRQKQHFQHDFWVVTQLF